MLTKLIHSLKKYVGSSTDLRFGLKNSLEVFLLVADLNHLAKHYNEKKGIYCNIFTLRNWIESSFKQIASRQFFAFSLLSAIFDRYQSAISFGTKHESTQTTILTSLRIPHLENQIWAIVAVNFGQAIYQNTISYNAAETQVRPVAQIYQKSDLIPSKILILIVSNRFCIQF